MLEILQGFIRLLENARTLDVVDEATEQFAMSMLTFSMPPVGMLETMAIGMLFILSAINAYAIIATEGAHILKLTRYLSIMLALSAVCMVAVPPLVRSIM